MRERMTAIWPVVREHMEKAQRAQAQVYNRGAQPWEFQVGDRVLALIPMAESKFLATWHRPYEVIEKLGPVNYRVWQPGRWKPQQIYHVNLAREDSLGRVRVGTQDANGTSGGPEQ
jgi:hypothetical protein